MCLHRAVSLFRQRPRPAAPHQRRRNSRESSTEDRAMAIREYNVLFLCTGNSARSVMAECAINRWGRGKFTCFSAGSHPKGAVHPLTLELLRELNYETRSLRSKSGTSSPLRTVPTSISSSQSAIRQPLSSVQFGRASQLPRIGEPPIPPPLKGMTPRSGASPSASTASWKIASRFSPACESRRSIALHSSSASRKSGDSNFRQDSKGSGDPVAQPMTSVCQ
jgi:hypothetical protein